MQCKKNTVGEEWRIRMKRITKCEIVAVVYSICFLAAYSILRKNLIFPWIEMTGASFHLRNLLCMLSFLVVYGVTFCTILRGSTAHQWREHMKKNIIGWIILLSSCVSFFILMTEIYRHMGSKNDAIEVIIAASIIYFPNVWALTQVNKVKA